MKNALLRVIDANFNRAKEALRVTEDISRFVLNDKKLAAGFKTARHNLSKILLSLPVKYRDLVAARDSENDVAKEHVISDKGKKSLKWEDLMTANLKRAQEALRVLEESSKTLGPSHAKKIQKVRFDCYELERRSILKF